MKQSELVADAAFRTLACGGDPSWHMYRAVRAGGCNPGRLRACNGAASLFLCGSVASECGSP